MISIRFLFIGTIGIILCFALNSLFIRLLADPSGTAFSNFSWALYGLASGGHSFNYVFQQHPEVLLLKDPEQSRTIYRMAFDLIIQNPDLLVKGILQRYSTFFSNSWYSAFSFLESENGVVYIITRWMTYTLCVLGLVKWIRKPGDPYSGLATMGALGVLLSVPFVPPTDAYRVRLYAASIVMFGLLPAMGVSLIVNQIKLGWLSRPDPRIQDSNVTAVIGGLLVVMIFGGTLLTKASSRPASALSVTCPPGEEAIAIQFNAGSSVNILSERSLFLDWMPNFHQGQFKRSIHGLADVNLIEYLEEIPAGTSIFSALDHLSNRAALVIAPTRQLPEPGAYVGLCGRWETDPKLEIFHLFFAESVIPPDESQ